LKGSLIVVTKEMIRDDLKNCSLSQWFNKQGLCSVEEIGGGHYYLTISTGVTRSSGKILASYNDLSLDEIIQITNDN